MILEIWERLRGFDKWPQVEATIQSSAVEKATRLRKGSRVDEWKTVYEIAWTDPAGLLQRKQMALPGMSRDLNLIDGVGISVRYKPTDYSKFFIREELRRRILKEALLGLPFLIALVLLLAVVWR
jgi:hypothetical protein